MHKGNYIFIQIISGIYLYHPTLHTKIHMLMWLDQSYILIMIKKGDRKRECVVYSSHKSFLIGIWSERDRNLCLYPQSVLTPPILWLNSGYWDLLLHPFSIHPWWYDLTVPSHILTKVYRWWKILFESIFYFQKNHSENQHREGKGQICMYHVLVLNS